MKRLCCIHGAMWLVFVIVLAWGYFAGRECERDIDGCAQAMRRYP